MYGEHDPKKTDERWVRVEEGLPDDEIEVLVYLEVKDAYYLAFREEKLWYSSFSGVEVGEEANTDIYQGEISHWRYLVPPADAKPHKVDEE